MFVKPILFQEGSQSRQNPSSANRMPFVNRFTFGKYAPSWAHFIYVSKAPETAAGSHVGSPLLVSDKDQPPYRAESLMADSRFFQYNGLSLFAWGLRYFPEQKAQLPLQTPLPTRADTL
jgi:hypothetical protein